MHPFRFLAPLALAIVTAIVLLITLEFGLRLAFPGDAATLTSGGSLRSLAYQFNPDYGVSLKPDQHKIFRRHPANGGYIVPWQTNADGFRGAPLQTNPGFRVIVYGDSNIQARFSGQERSFTGQLASRLSDHGVSDAEVINAGIVGAGPDQNLIRFTQQVDSLNPELVIFHLFADNDFGDIIRNRLFDLDDAGHLSRSPHPLEPDAQLTSSWRQRLRDLASRLLVVKQSQAMLQRWFGWPTAPDAGTHQRPLQDRRQFEVDFLLKRAQQEFTVYQAGQARKFSHFADHYDYDLALFPSRADSREKVRLMEAVLTRAHQQARQRGIDFLVLIQPSVIDLTDDNALMNASFLSKFPDYKADNLSSIIEQIGRKHDIPVVNLMPAFRDNKPATLFFTAGDDHWTDRGQALAAEQTVNYLSTQGLLPVPKREAAKIQQ